MIIDDKHKCNYCDKECFSKYFICSECNTLKSEDLIDRCRCGNYKDFSNYLCSICEKIIKEKGINDYVIKGRIAEAIIEEMFINMDYEVFRFGMENTIPGFGRRKFPRQGDVAHQIRSMPDFVVVKDNKTNFVEVKYRSDDKFLYEEEFGAENYPYPEAYLILVTPKHIKVQKIAKLARGEDFVYLNDCPDFQTDKSVILQYIEFCKKFFQN